MNRKFLFAISFIISLNGLEMNKIQAQGMAVNTTGATADNSAMLDVSSTTKGVLVPRLTSTQRTGIASPAVGLLVYQTSAPEGFYYNSGSGWVMVSSTSHSYADFYALMPSDNAATVAAGSDVSFPENGPGTGDIVSTSASTFLLPYIGTYQVSFQVSVSEAGQLVLTLNGSNLAYTAVGRATLTSQITGVCLVTTTTVNSILTVRNPAGNPSALTITPGAGGSIAVSAHLVITRIQ